METEQVDGAEPSPLEQPVSETPANEGSQPPEEELHDAVPRQGVTSTWRLPLVFPQDAVLAYTCLCLYVGLGISSARVLQVRRRGLQASLGYYLTCIVPPELFRLSEGYEPKVRSSPTLFHCGTESDQVSVTTPSLIFLLQGKGVRSQQCGTRCGQG